MKTLGDAVAGAPGPARALANAPAYQHPRHGEFVAALPRAGTGKIDRRVLVEPATALVRAARP